MDGTRTVSWDDPKDLGRLACELSGLESMRRLIDEQGRLAALSRRTDLTVGCYCGDEARCHRSILRELLVEHGAVMAEGSDETTPGA